MIPISPKHEPFDILLIFFIIKPIWIFQFCFPFLTEWKHQDCFHNISFPRGDYTGVSFPGPAMKNQFTYNEIRMEKQVAGSSRINYKPKATSAYAQTQQRLTTTGQEPASNYNRVSFYLHCHWPAFPKHILQMCGVQLSTVVEEVWKLKSR